MPGHITPKTIEVIELIKHVWVEGDSARVIGAKVGMSRAAIIGLFDRHAARLAPVKLLERTPAKEPRVRKPRAGKTTTSRVPSKPKPLPPRYQPRVPAAPIAVRPRIMPPYVEGEQTMPALPNAPTPLRLSLLDLNHDQCRYPYGADEIAFCGHPSTYRSYCEYHANLVYIRAPQRMSR